MRHVGLVAHSPDGAALAFTSFCHLGQDRFGEPLHPDISLDYIAMGRTLPNWNRDDRAGVRAVLAKSIARLEASGAEFFFCPDNTAHIALEHEGPPFAIPGINIASITAARARDRNMTRVGILGTRFTMNGPVYARAFGAAGIDWCVPEVGEQDVVDQIIFSELCRGIVSETSRQTYQNAIERLKDRGCDGVALACTEIPLLISEADSPLPCLDTTRLITEAAFEIGIEQVAMPSWRGGPV